MEKITIQVDSETAQAYRNANPEKKRKIQTLLNFILNKMVNEKSLLEIMEEASEETIAKFMSEEQKQPKPTDAVLGGTTQSFSGKVLDAVQGVKKKLESSDQAVRVEALQKAIDYGEEGLKLLREAALKDKIAVAEHPNTPVEILHSLAQDKDGVVRWKVAENPKTPVEILQSLAQDENDDVRFEVAGNSNTPVEALQSLAQDEIWFVRWVVAGNDNASVKTLQSLDRDRNEMVREKADSALRLRRFK